MTRQQIIENTVSIISKLPPDKAEEISDFADFIIKKYEEQAISYNIQKLVSDSKAFDFLNEEESLYTVDDLKNSGIMPKGDIVLIPFPFTDLTGNKLRPAVILIDAEPDVTVSFITTQLKWKESTDVEIIPSQTNGIKKISLIRLNKIATIDKTLAIGKLGNLDLNALENINTNLKKLFQLV